MSRGRRPSGAPPIPRGRLDPIRDPRSALAVFGLLAARPRRHETMLMVLDRHWRGELVVVVDGTDPDGDPPDEPLIDVVELGAQVAGDTLGPKALGLVVASVRRGRDLRSGDTETWSAMDSLARERGLVLVEWFVAAPGGIHCPRDVAGDPARWPG